MSNYNRNTDAIDLYRKLPHACEESKSYMKRLMHGILWCDVEDLYNQCEEPMWLVWLAVDLGVDENILLDVIERLKAAELLEPDYELDYQEPFTRRYLKRIGNIALRYYYVISDIDTFANRATPIKDNILSVVKSVLTLDVFLNAANGKQNKSPFASYWESNKTDNDI